MKAGRAWYVMKILGMADGSPSPAAGHYVLDFDPDAFGGRGEIQTTRNAGNAKRFPEIGAAWDFWQLQSVVEPARLDGNPNRPLTAYSVVMERVSANGG